MGRRLQLHSMLRTLVPNVYFQPPENFKLSYPCIVYQLADLTDRKANNRTYTQMDRYQVTYITRDPDDSFIRDFPMQFNYCSLDRFFITSNLNHYNYTLFY